MIRRPVSFDVLVSGVLLCAGFGYFYAFRRLGWFLQDDGVLFYQYLRTYRGQLPYRDFFTGYGPVTLYLHGALFSLFGVSVEATRIFMAFVNSLSGVFLYAVSRRVAPRGLALVPPLLFLSMQPGDIASMAFHNTPYPLWYAVTLMSGGAWAMLRALEAERPARRAAWLVTAGALGGLAFLVKQNAGVYFLWGVTGFLVSSPAVVRRGDDREPWLSTCLRLGYLGLIPLAALVLIKNFITPATVMLFVLPTAGLMLVGARRRVAPVALRLVLGQLAWVSLGVAIVVSPWLVHFGRQMGVGAFLKALLLVGVDVDRNLYLAFPPPRPVTLGVLLMVAGSGLLVRFAKQRGNGQRIGGNRTRWLPRTAARTLSILLALVLLWGVGIAESVRRLLRLEYNLWRIYQVTSMVMDNLAAYTVLLVLAGGLAVAWRQARGRVRDEDPPAQPFLCLLWVAACTLILYYPRMDAAHLVSAAPLSYAVAMALLPRVRVKLAGALVGRDSRTFRWVFYSMCALAFAFVAGWKLAPKVYSRFMLARTDQGLALVPTPTESLELDAASLYFPVYEPAQRLPIVAFREVIDQIRGSTRADEPIFTFPALSLFYFFSDRQNPTRHDYFLGNNVTFDEQVELIRTLERAQVPLVVVPGDVNDYFLKKARDFTHLIEDYLDQRYYRERRLGPYDILRRYGTTTANAPLPRLPVADAP